jgi:peptidoglycan/xylan/chitin deacetylase (PgdA/CDA1 family)
MWLNRSWVIASGASAVMALSLLFAPLQEGGTNRGGIWNGSKDAIERPVDRGGDPKGKNEAEASAPSRERPAERPRPATVYYSDRVAVLMYHHLQEEPERGDILSPAQFERQMELLAENGFQVIDAEEYAAFVLNKAKVPDNAVLLTFDDGYASFYELAYPVLKKFGYPAINFVIVSGVDQRDKPGIKKLTWDQMREMQKDGIAFMNHTYDLHAKKADAHGKEVPLTGRKYMEDERRGETAEEYRKRVLDDLQLAEKRLSEELGNELRMIAFPYGYYTDELVSVAREAGIEIMFSVKHGLTKRSDKVAYRVNAGRSDMEPEELIRTLKALGKGKTGSVFAEAAAEAETAPAAR